MVSVYVGLDVIDHEVTDVPVTVIANDGVTSVTVGKDKIMIEPGGVVRRLVVKRNGKRDVIHVAESDPRYIEWLNSQSLRTRYVHAGDYDTDAESAALAVARQIGWNPHDRIV